MCQSFAGWVWLLRRNVTRFCRHLCMPSHGPNRHHGEVMATMNGLSTCA